MHGGMVATWCGLHKRSASRTEHEWLCLQWLQYFTSILGISCLVITCWKSPTIINSPVWMCLKKWRYRIQHNMLWYMMAGCFTRGNYNTLINTNTNVVWWFIGWTWCPTFFNQTHMWFTLPCSTPPCLLTNFKQPLCILDNFSSGPASLQ